MEANVLTGNGVEKIAEAIQRRERMLNLVKFDRSLIYNQGGIAISSCLGKIQSLMMMYCGITSVGVEAISTALQSSQHLLQTLELSSNDIGDTGANALSLSLKNIKQLIIMSCNISCRGVQMLSDAIASLEAPMKELNIAYNKIGDEGIEAILGCLSNINHLNITGCDVKEAGLTNLFRSIHLLQNHFMKITLDKNQISDAVAEAISGNFNNIQHLSMEKCEITSTGINFICNSISGLQNPMEELNISENNIGDSGIEAISTCVQNIKSLMLKSCGMTSLGVQYLSNALHQLPQPIKKQNIRNNDIESDGGVILSTCLQGVETLNITQCKITGAGVMAMSKAIKAMHESDSGCSVVGLYAQ